MTKIRVERNKNYTTIATYALNDITLSWRAKGLWAFMLSLPDNWRFSIRGLATRARDGRTVVAKGLQELREHGYLVTRFIRNEQGQIIKNEYVLYEYSQIPGYYDKKVKPREQALQEVIHKNVDNSASERPSTANQTQKAVSENLNTETPCSGNQTEKPLKKASVSENLSTVTLHTVTLPELNNTCTNILNNRGDKNIYNSAPSSNRGREISQQTPPKNAKELSSHTDPRREYALVDPQNPPTPEDVEAYCLRLREAGVPMHVDSDEFVDFYYMKGWDKIRDWKATIRNWQRRQERQQEQNAVQTARQDVTATAKKRGNTLDRDYQKRVQPLLDLYEEYDREEQEARKRQSVNADWTDYGTAK